MQVGQSQENKITVVVKPLLHRESNNLALYFPYNKELIATVKKLQGASFSKSNTCWYITLRDGLLSEILSAFEGKAIVDYSAIEAENKNKDDALSVEHQVSVRLMEQKLHLKGYAKPTCKTYLDQFKRFLLFYNHYAANELSESEIRNYLLYLVEKKKVSRSTQNTAINAIKFFYEIVLMQERKVYYLERPLKERTLPQVLSQEEVAVLFTVTENIKHKAMLMLLYSAGLRRGELLRMRLGDVDFNRGVVFIKGGKGRKDRQSILANVMMPVLKKYLEEHKPTYWLFEGVGGGQYGERSIQQVLMQAKEKAGIKAEITLHTLRHSFATHLLEAGTATRYIQELLGHESPLTTEIYTRVTRFALEKIKSPLDQLGSTNFLENGSAK